MLVRTPPPPSKEKERELKERWKNRSWNPYSTPADYAHQAWQIASEASGSVAIFNTQTNSYITAPSSMPSSLSRSPPAHSQLLDLTEGVNPSENIDAQVYGGVPGSATDEYMQWVIIQNSDNSIRYSSLFIFLAPLAFFCSFQMEYLDEKTNLKVY
jgi:hypothetical protein